jgi:hypothetical protein
MIAADLDNIPLARLLLEKGANVQYFSGFSLSAVIMDIYMTVANSAPCMLRGRPRWCSCSWTTRLIPILKMTSDFCRYTGMLSGTT